MFERNIDFFNLVHSISVALDLVDRRLSRHHVRVAYIATSLSRAGYLDRKQESDILVASLLHDIGAMRRDERVEFLQFEDHHVSKHAEIGFQLLQDFDLFEEAAHILRFHHVPWEGGRGRNFFNCDVSLSSHILHLADRVDILIDYEKRILPQREKILGIINKGAPALFHPAVTEWFDRLARKDEFWLDLTSSNLSEILKNRVKAYEIELTYDVLAEFAHLMSQLVDFRSRFTSTHSSGVSASAEYIARLLGFSERECQKIMIAGFLHDIGKLAIPTEILEKNGRLTDEEFDIIKSHSYHTARILQPVQGIEEISLWCSFHHEKLDGTGYPFKEVGANIPLAARVISVADVFTALTEDRPYRTGLGRKEVITILHEMVEESHLDKRIVSILFENYADINDYRHKAQEYATSEYERFVDKVQLFADWFEHRSPEILEMEAMENGSLLFERSFFQADPFLHEMVISGQKSIDATRIIRLIEDRRRIRLYGDRKLLERSLALLLNLLANSKASSNGIEIGLEASDDNTCPIGMRSQGVLSGHDHVVFYPTIQSLKNHLPEFGIRENYQVLFAKTVLERHKGTLRLTACEGVLEGISLALPIRQPDVLIVDDDPISLDVLRTLLEGIGVAVRTAADGTAALESVERKRPDLVVCDVNMPEISGFDVLAILKSRSMLKTIPFIMVTSDELIETRTRALQSGADDFITKPLRKKDLYPRVQRFTG